MPKKASKKTQPKKAVQPSSDFNQRGLDEHLAELKPASSASMKRYELSTKQIFSPCDPAKFKFKTTEEIKCSNKIIDQSRAVRAIRMGLGIRKPGFNIYVAGMEGTGKTSVIKSFLQQTANKIETPDDWCYVHNFEREQYPIAINLPAGEGKKFKREMENLVEQLTLDVREALQSEEYENNVNARMYEGTEQKNQLYTELEGIAHEMGFSLKSSRMGIITVPMKDGKTLSEKEYKLLPEKERSDIEKRRGELEPRVMEFARAVRIIDQETRSVVEEMQNELGNYVIDLSMESMLKKYKKSKRVLEYLNNVKENFLNSILEFIEQEEEREKEEHVEMRREVRPFLEYEVNVYVDNSKQSGAPVVIENNPTYYNLFGKIEKKIEYGIYITDLSNIKAGSINRANQGFLVINAMDLFKNPLVWDTLKRMLRNRMSFIEDMGENYGLLPTSGLSPESIPLDVKVVLVGTDDIYHLLFRYDEEFKKIFKVKADFDYRMPRNARTIQGYVSFIATRSHLEKLKHFDPSGVAAIVELSSRLVDSQKHMSSSFGEIKDVIIESDFIAREKRARYIRRDHVEQAVKERFKRSDMINEHILQNMLEDNILISTNENEVGQANGLAVYGLGDISFGKPSRITSKVFRGKPGVINIEREADMSGATHTKGVHILSALFQSKFSLKVPLGLSATICFEQNYGGIDGDSASSTEFYVISSAMSGIPLKQSIAITGSINQNGEIQPIGGVNEKIEGFFEVCQSRKLTGDQGVIIPHQNIPNLMLNQEVRDAVESGLFHIYAVKTVDEGLEILTGYKAGKLDKKGNYTKGSIYRLIADKMEALYEEEKDDN